MKLIEETSRIPDGGGGNQNALFKITTKALLSYIPEKSQSFYHMFFNTFLLVLTIQNTKIKF